MVSGLPTVTLALLRLAFAAAPRLPLNLATMDNSPALRSYVRDITKRVLAEGLPQGVCLNVNFPLVEAYSGVKVCRMAFGTWYNECTKCHHPRGYDYWWMVGHYRNDEPESEDTDNWALTHGYIAITPTQIDVTAYKAIDQIKQWNL